jgi:hypothetical protein
MAYGQRFSYLVSTQTRQIQYQRPPHSPLRCCRSRFAQKRIVPPAVAALIPLPPTLRRAVLCLALRTAPAARKPSVSLHHVVFVRYLRPAHAAYPPLLHRYAPALDAPLRTTSCTFHIFI